MKPTKLTSKLYPLIRAVATAAVLPVLFIYIMVAKPDYKIMNALGHVVVPVAQWVGDVITWPIRLVGDAIDNVSEVSALKTENKELRARLDAALINKTKCDIAIAENQHLMREIGIAQSQPRKTIVADVVFDNRAMGHNTYLINRGRRDGIEAGMVVTTTDLQLAGIVIDSANNFSRVRGLTDSDTNIAVRVVGSEVYGFMTGNGSNKPTMGFFSDPEFQPTAGIKLVTSSISGVLPAGLMVGEMIDDTDVAVVPQKKLSRVMVLKYDTINNEYK